MPKHIEDDFHRIADIRLLHGKVMDLYNGMNALRAKYPDQDLLKFADTSHLGELHDAAEKLRQVVSWIAVLTDALSDRERK